MRAVRRKNMRLFHVHNSLKRDLLRLFDADYMPSMLWLINGLIITRADEIQRGVGNEKKHAVYGIQHVF